MHLKSLLYILFIFLLSACRNEQESFRLLKQAESLLTTDPDSASALLNQMPVPGRMNSKELAKWCMLAGECANKRHDDMPFTDWLLQAQEWYGRHGSPEEQARIGLFLGRSYAEDREHKKAMNVYMNALDIAKKNKIDNQAGYISSYMADLYIFENMASEARIKYEEGAEYFQKAGNQRSYALALRDVSRMLAFSDSIAEAFLYMKKADSIALSLNDPKAISSISNGLGNLYEIEGDYQKAKTYYLKSLEKENNAPTYLALSSMYTNSGDLEQARIYLEKANLETQSLETSVDIIYQQFLIAKADHQTEKALYYLEQYDLATDSITMIQNESNIAKVEKKYQQEKILIENSKLRISKQNHFILIILLCIICLSVFAFYQIVLNRKQKEIYKQQIILDQNKLHLLELKDKLVDGEQSLSQLKNEFNKTNEQLCMQSSLENQQQEYQKQKTELETIIIEIQELRKEKLSTSAIARKVQSLSQSVKAGADKSLLTAKDWNAIQSKVDEIYISLPQIVQNNNLSLTSSDIECCYLSFFRLDPNEEAILLNINPHSVSRRRTRLREKLGIKGEENSLYEYLTKI